LLNAADKKSEMERRGAMTIRTQLRAGGGQVQHNETLVVRTSLKAGKLAVNQAANHNEGLRVRSTLKAGGEHLNHNETWQSALR
jgi:hypothetical protein